MTLKSRPAAAVALGLAVFFATAIAASAGDGQQAERRSVGANGMRAAHYFGLTRYSWPINYLNSIDMSRLDADFEQIVADGFTAVILLVPWGEIQPVLRPVPSFNEAAVSTLEAIVRGAHRHGLEVVFRLPYLWAINPGQQMPNAERMSALLADADIRAAFLDTVRMLDRRLIRPHPHVRFVFATWEDFYQVTRVAPERLPRAMQQAFSAFARQRHADADLAKMLGRSVKPSNPVPVPNRNAQGWQLFLEFVDQQIDGVTNEMAAALSVPVSFEVRVDSDPVLAGRRVTDWYVHHSTYDVDTSDLTTVYYAAYLGQQNRGERLTARQAIDALRHVYDQGVRPYTRNRLFIDQFNVTFNTPGFESHARLADDQLAPFLAEAARYIGTTMFGYGLWGYKDYHNNLLYNARFQQALSGWSAEGAVDVLDGGVRLEPGEGVVQRVSAALMRLSRGEELDLCVSASSATGGALTVTPGRRRATIFRLAPGSAVGSHCLDLPKRTEDHDISLRATGGTVLVEGAVLSGHEEIAGIYDSDNKPAPLHRLFVGFNRQLAAVQAERCPEQIEETMSLEGKFDDGWLTTSVQACLKVHASSSPTTIELRLLVPEPLPVPVRGVVTAGSVRQPFSLTRGSNVVTLSLEVSAATELPVSIRFDDTFVPKATAGGGADERRLAAIFKGLRVVRRPEP